MSSSINYFNSDFNLLYALLIVLHRAVHVSFDLSLDLGVMAMPANFKLTVKYSVHVK